MTVTIELPPDVEAALSAVATREGLSLRQYLRRLLEEQALVRAASVLSPAERADAWRRSVEGLPILPPLSDEAISRASIYEARG